jgi:3-oxoacyl-[acyl-carrier-protein] synthase III
MSLIRTIISGTGSHIPKLRVLNEDFSDSVFYDLDGQKLQESTQETIETFRKKTGIKERRYVTDDLVTSDIAYFALRDALDSAGICKESINGPLGVAHNFGDVRADNRRSDFVPSIASRVKQKAGIKNPKTIAFDYAYGCPGWLGLVYTIHCRFQMGEETRGVAAGAETLSRVADLKHDRNGMIYADGGGVAILDAVRTKEQIGILSYIERSDTGILSYTEKSDKLEGADLLYMGRSDNPNLKGNDLFLKMQGRKVYKYALRTVPGVVKESLDKANLKLKDVKKVIIHQANEELDRDVLKWLFKKYGQKQVPEEVIQEIMPMTVSWLGNSSVATLPTLLDLITKGKLGCHKFTSGDVIVMASVGAGMNVNSMVYRIP